MDALLESFISESKENIDKIEALLTKFGKDPGQECREDLYRTIHSIKDTSELFDLPHITGLSHAFEKLAYKILAGSYLPDNTGIRICQKVCGSLLRMIEEIEHGTVFDIEPMVKVLKGLPVKTDYGFPDYGCMKSLIEKSSGKTNENKEEDLLSSAEIVEIEDISEFLTPIELSPPVEGIEEYDTSQVIELPEDGFDPSDFDDLYSLEDSPSVSVSETVIPDEELQESEFTSGGVFLNYVARYLDFLEDSAVRLETSFDDNIVISLKETFYIIYCGGTHFSKTIAYAAKKNLCLLHMLSQKRISQQFTLTDTLLKSCETIRNIVYGETPDISGLDRMFSSFDYFDESFSTFIPENPLNCSVPGIKHVQVPGRYIRYAQNNRLYIIQLAYSLEKRNRSTVIDRLNSSGSIEVLRNILVDDKTLYVFGAQSDLSLKISPAPDNSSILFAPETCPEAETDNQVSESRSPMLKEALYSYMQNRTENGELLGIFDEMVELSASSGIESVRLIERIHRYHDQAAKEYRI